ncbi:hypothetical protein CYMTET_20358 [Cymbomonas tetramitiformis]|uniref:Uncharacterized protein n=1 Tax=Cymbomonas tetramitiformis TaxID=36881 RepID=A0AAE0G4A3_9CHLO|nr:hypothetical protein CYMTET_20358 [Cymbomonas tetramitiformis]
MLWYSMHNTPIRALVHTWLGGAEPGVWLVRQVCVWCGGTRAGGAAVRSAHPTRVYVLGRAECVPVPAVLVMVWVAGCGVVACYACPAALVTFALADELARRSGSDSDSSNRSEQIRREVVAAVQALDISAMVTRGLVAANPPSATAPVTQSDTPARGMRDSTTTNLLSEQRTASGDPQSSAQGALVVNSTTTFPAYQVNVTDGGIIPGEAAQNLPATTSASIPADPAAGVHPNIYNMIPTPPPPGDPAPGPEDPAPPPPGDPVPEPGGPAPGNPGPGPPGDPAPDPSYPHYPEVRAQFVTHDGGSCGRTDQRCREVQLPSLCRETSVAELA